MRHLYHFRLGSTFGLLLISLVIALSAVWLLFKAISNTEPKQLTKEVALLNSKTTS
jgi:hypothetical protein